jgi:hypothetical protein
MDINAKEVLCDGSYGLVLLQLRPRIETLDFYHLLEASCCYTSFGGSISLYLLRLGVVVVGAVTNYPCCNSLGNQSSLHLLLSALECFSLLDTQTYAFFTFLGFHLRSLV